MAMKVSVIGGGIAGLAVSIALSQRGFDVEVFEQAPKITEVGAGLQITPNGFAVLDGLGLGADIRNIGLASEGVVLRAHRHGNQVLRLNLAGSRRNGRYLFVHRADIIDLLARAARAAGVKIELDKEVSGVSEQANGAEIRFANGDVRATEMLIGADGLHSKVREALNGEAAPFFTGQVAWRAIVPETGDTASEVTVHMGPGRHLVRYPLRGGDATNIVAVEERQEWVAEGWNHSGEPEKLRAAFASFGGDVPKLLGRVEDVGVWGLFRHPVAKRWYRGNVALLGDAAHPTLPFLAQGANMALEDAWVLAACMANAPMPAALPAYQNARRARVVRVIDAANSNANNYHLRNPLIRLIAHAGLRAAGAIAPARMLGRFDWIYQHDVTDEFPLQNGDA